MQPGRYNGAPFVILFLAMFAILMGAGAANAQQQPFDYEMGTFVWTAGLEGRQGVGEAVADVDASFDELAEFLDVGAAVRLRARREPLGWYGEVSYIKIGDDLLTPAGNVSARSMQAFADVGVLYTLVPALFVYGGARYQKLDIDIDTPLASRDSDADWIDAVAGLQWMPVDTDTWTAWARADIGGGSSDLVWLAEVGGGFRFAERWAGYLAYRVLDTDYENGEFVYDIQQSGMILGFGYRF